MNRPLIGLPGRRKKGSQIVDWVRALDHIDVDLYIADYATAVLAAGGLPVHIPMDVDPTDIAGELDGLVLTGGADIDPHLYGAEPQTDDFPPEVDRDTLELALIEQAADLGTPILGICRGLQIINVAHGGTLNQHDEAHAGFDLPPETELHEVHIAEGSALHDMYGPRRAVNSLHHQTIDVVGDGLRVAAAAPDGVVEAIEGTDRPVVAVQWHPEMMTTAHGDPVFAWIVEQAATFRARRLKFPE